MTNSRSLELEPELPRPEKPKGNEGVFRGLMAMYIHQNRLMWTRVQTILVVQGGAVAGGHHLLAEQNPGRFDVGAGTGLLFGAAFLSLVLAGVVRRDQQVRNHHRQFLETIGSELIGKEFVLAPPTRWFTAGLKGDHILLVLLVFCFAMDLVLLVVYR